MEVILLRKFISLNVFIVIMMLSFTIAFAQSQDKLDAKPIRIGVIDTGISSTAIAIENLMEGKNYILQNKSTEDYMGHGTAVAGIIVGNEALGIEGICPSAELVPLVYYSKSDDVFIKGNLPILAKIIRDAVDVYDCDIINISSGARVDTPALRDAIAWAEQQGVLVVASAGNDGDGTIYFPGVFPSVVCVGTVNESKDGPAIFSNRYKGVDLLAQGLEIPTLNVKGEVVHVNGTSFSTAWVTGTAATILTKYPNLTPYELRQFLFNGSRDICSEGYDIDSGWGIVDFKSIMTKIELEKTIKLHFEDVKEGSYYENPVIWAINKGVTSGTTANTFSPDMICTRAQTMTFMWRAVGCPEPRITNNPFKDIKETDYFYKALLWAWEMGFVSGITDTSFNPHDICTESEAITFIWRANNRPNAAGSSEIASTLGDYYYTDAVAWADTQGLFTATRIGFIAKRKATRAQIVTYLYYSISNNQ